MKPSFRVELPANGVKAVRDADRPGAYTIEVPNVGEVRIYQKTSNGDVAGSVLDQVQAFLKHAETRRRLRAENTADRPVTG